ncbi:MAG: hypothetical protein KUG51_02040 [Urechidicola sp.]|nr:hypothetical protein [Urechidicola sp.]
MKKTALKLLFGFACISIVLIIYSWQNTNSESVKDSEFKWYRGNTHTHTLWSDGNDFPEIAADWYKNHGYHFLVLTDHNILSRGDKWKNINKHIAKNDLITKYENHFGKGLLELKTTDDKTLVKLKTLEEVRSMVEESGKFIMIEGMELTSTAGIEKDKKKRLPVHSNVINIDEKLISKQQKTVEKQIENHNHIIAEYIEKTEHPVFWHINHPNFKYSNTAEQVAHAQHAHGLEVFNPSGGCHNSGDEIRPNTEKIWDIVNTLRLKEYGYPPLFACATDDTHNYHTSSDHNHLTDTLKDAPGLAWVMVKSKTLSPDAISKAMQTGDFYSSTGIELKALNYDAESRKISIEINAQTDVNYTITFIGSPKDVSLDHVIPDPVIDEKGISHPVTGTYSDKRLGAVLKVVRNQKATYQLSDNDLYVRAVITCDDAITGIIDDGPIQKKAWTQPFGWEKSLE